MCILYKIDFVYGYKRGDNAQRAYRESTKRLGTVLTQKTDQERYNEPALNFVL
jgi:hypothetical protein